MRMPERFQGLAGPLCADARDGRQLKQPLQPVCQQPAPQTAPQQPPQQPPPQPAHPRRQRSQQRFEAMGVLGAGDAGERVSDKAAPVPQPCRSNLLCASSAEAQVPNAAPAAEPTPGRPPHLDCSGLLGTAYEVSKVMGGTDVPDLLPARDRARPTDRGDWVHKHTVGFLDTIALVFVLARYPEYSWIVYACRCVLMIPAWFWGAVRRGSGMNVLEACWVANILSAVYFVVTLCVYCPDEETQLFFFQAFFAAALGFLSWASMLADNALIFHSLSELTFLFIHVVPAVVCMAVRWQAELQVHFAPWPCLLRPAAAAAAPQLAFRPEALAGTTAPRLVAAGLLPYGGWWVLHTLWLLLRGHRQSSKTGFAVFRRSHQDAFERCGFTDVRVHAAIYMALHATAVVLSFCWAAICWRSIVVHILWLLTNVTYVLWRTAGKYMQIFYMQGWEEFFDNIDDAEL